MTNYPLKARALRDFMSSHTSYIHRNGDIINVREVDELYNFKYEGEYLYFEAGALEIITKSNGFKNLYNKLNG